MDALQTVPGAHPPRHAKLLGQHVVGPEVADVRHEPDQPRRAVAMPSAVVSWRGNRERRNKKASPQAWMLGHSRVHIATRLLPTTPLLFLNTPPASRCLRTVSRHPMTARSGLPSTALVHMLAATDIEWPHFTDSSADRISDSCFGLGDSLCFSSLKLSTTEVQVIRARAFTDLADRTCTDA